MGGIISENTSTTVKKVPLLGDIPLLGWAFKTNTKSKVKTEVVLLITPRTISKAEEIDTIREEILNRMDLLEGGLFETKSKKTLGEKGKNSPKRSF